MSIWRATRRQWLKRTGIAAAACAAGVVVDTFWIEPHWLEFVRRDLPIAGLPPAWQGKTLAQISDIHVGHQVSDAYVRDSFARLADYAPDIVAFTGDFITNQHDGAAPLAQARSVYASIPRGQRATVGILGNHDYGWTFSDAARAAEVVDLLNVAGVRMLRNESLTLDGLELIGLDDLWAGRCDGQTVYSRAATAEARLVLCHNPDAADLSMWGDYRGWILAGHTHGGQCKPPFLPPPLLPVRNRRYTSGEFDLHDGRRLYINRGLGHLRAVRFNARPEITLFTLTRSAAG